MKRFILCMVLWLSFLFSSSVLAKEPILVIDPHGHSSIIHNIMFTPNGKTLISVSEDKTIRLWDVETGDLAKTLRHQIGEGHEGKIHSGAISPDGKILAIGGWPYGSGEHGNPVYLFNLDNGEIIGLLDGHPDVVMSMDFSQDGKWLASGSSSTIRIWDMSNIGSVPIVIIKSEAGVFDLAFSPDGKTLVSGHIDNMVRSWDLSKSLEEAQQSGKQTLTEPERVLKKHTNVASCVAYSPDGKYIVSTDFDGNYFLWDAKKGKIKKKFPVMMAAGDIAFSDDSKHVVLTNGYKAEVYTVPKGKKTKTFEKHASPVETNAFSNSVTAIAFHGNDLVATAGGIDYDIYIWDVKTGDVKTHISGKRKKVEAVAFGEDLHVAFGNTSGGIHKAGPLERSFDFAEMTLNQKTPDENDFRRTQTEYEGKTLEYTPGHKDPENWYTLKVKGGGTIKNERKHGWVRAYTFTPNGDVVVGSSHALRLHRSDGEFIRDFVGHTGELRAVSISQDGKILVSASDDQTIRLWNLETGECLATLFITRDREWVCWTPQGYYAASAGGEKYIGWQLNQGMDKAAKFHPVSVFRTRFYQPELVKRTIVVGNFEQALAELNLEPQPTVVEVLPPKVQWISPKEPAIEMSQPSIRIQAKIHSDTELMGVKILVNGRTQATGRGLMVDQQEKNLDNVIDQEITLIPGRNEIAIFAANKDAGAPSEPRIVLYEAEELKPDLYMVSIGISDYQRGDLQLAYADDDAKAISQVFRG
jgi:WD40 repeat protein